MADDNSVEFVDSRQLPSGIATLLRYGLTVAGTAMVTDGILPAGSDVNAIVGAVLVVASTAYGMWLTYKNKRTVVKAVVSPESVALK